ncbi:hypothetical protein GH733_018331, partial [Mirounga leonina]
MMFNPANCTMEDPRSQVPICKAVGHLIAAVLKENGFSEKIHQSTNQICQFIPPEMTVIRHHDFPVELVTIGIALLLLQTPASQQKPILSLEPGALALLGPCTTKAIRYGDSAFNLNLISKAVCIGQILRVIQLLGTTPQLRAVTLRLLTSLWEKQDRVYPELQRLMATSDVPSLSVGREVQWEKLIAKAASIRDICKQRPYQHGADMLAAASQVLNECTKPDQATPAALVLQGLHALCQAEKSMEFASEDIVPYREVARKAATSHIRPEIPTPDELDEDEDDEGDEKDVDLSIPGSCYLKLLSLTAPLVLPALEEFFTSLVKQEMVNMPRGVYHSALKGGVRSDQGKTVAGIPNFILKMYETNKQPGLKPGLAVDTGGQLELEVQFENLVDQSGEDREEKGGMLFCYDVSTYQSKDGKPLNRLMASRGRSFKQTSLALVHEVHIQLSEWHRAIFLPPAWLAYMSRAYHAILQGRTGELDLQLKHGKEGPEEVQYKKGTAWLWVRDMLTEEITKAAAKESPVVKGNALLALSSLAVIVSKHEASLSSDSEGVPEKSYSGENTASAIARSAAATALSLLVPVFMISCKEKVEEILNMLTARLPGKPRADESQAVQIHMGLALGMFLSRLCEEKLSTGCILGVGLVLSLMSHSSQTESRVHVAASLRKLSTYLDDSGSQSRTFQEVLAYTLSCVCTSAFSTGIIEAAEAEDIMNKLLMLVENNQQTSGFALALGNLVHGLSLCGHGKAEDLGHRLLPAWIRIVLAQGTPTMLCLAALHGMVALVGSEGDVTQLKSEAIQSSHFQARLNEVIKTVTQVISVSGVIGLQSNALWLLGHLHLSTLSSSQSRTSGPESVPPSLLKVVMKPIATVGESHQYPPVNWAALLSPLMRLNFGEEIQQLCLEIATTQAPSSQNAAALLGLWVTPPLVHGLSLNIKKYLLVSTPLWIKHVSEEQILGFVENRNDLELYVSIAKCLSEMTDDEANRVAQITESNLEKAAFVRLYLVSQGRFPLMGLMDILSVAVRHREKDTVAWMVVHSLYQARIVSHAN